MKKETKEKIIHILWQPVYWIIAPIYFLAQMIVIVIWSTFAIGGLYLIGPIWWLRDKCGGIDQKFPTPIGFLRDWLETVFLGGYEAAINAGFIEEDDYGCC